MKLTADTVTDEQIRELRAASPTSNPVIALCDEATAGIHRSRTRCAEIIDARAPVAVDRCPTCQTPTHASESDDTGRCSSCRGDSPHTGNGKP